MASWQSHIVVFIMKRRFKRKLSSVIDIEMARKSLAAIKHGVPKNLRAETGAVGGVAGEWTRANSQADAPTLLYLHGGAYIACSPQTHRPITGGFAKRGFAVFAPDYRLAPEHPFPAAIDDAVAAYRGLIASGIPASSITVAGDSAGGGLALAMLLSLRDAGDAMPAAMALFSPWTDLAATGASLVSNDRKDAMFYGEGVGRSAEIYLAGTDPKDPLASPLYAELQGLPPMLIHAGSYEVLRDDSIRLAERAQAAGVPVQIRLWPVLPHVWQVIPWIPEAAESLDAAAAFLLSSRPVRDMAA
jgi:monoterpene epsilon-lactone hydrolase